MSNKGNKKNAISLLSDSSDSEREYSKVPVTEKRFSYASVSRGSVDPDATDDDVGPVPVTKGSGETTDEEVGPLPVAKRSGETTDEDVGPIPHTPKVATKTREISSDEDEIIEVVRAKKSVPEAQLVLHYSSDEFAPKGEKKKGKEEDTKDPEESPEEDAKDAAPGTKKPKKARGINKEDAGKAVIVSLKSGPFSEFDSYKPVLDFMYSSDKRQTFASRFICDEKTRDYIFSLFRKFQSLVWEKSPLAIPAGTMIYMIFVFSGKVASRPIKDTSTAILNTSVAFCEMMMEEFLGIANQGEYDLKAIRRASGKVLRRDSAIRKMNKGGEKEDETEKYTDLDGEEQNIVKMRVAQDAFLFVMKFIVERVCPGKEAFGCPFTGDSFKKAKLALCKNVKVEGDSDFWQIIEAAYHAYIHEQLQERLGEDPTATSSDYFSDGDDNDKKLPPKKRTRPTGTKKANVVVKETLVHVDAEPVLEDLDRAFGMTPVPKPTKESEPTEMECESSDEEDEEIEPTATIETDTNESRLVVVPVKTEPQTQRIEEGEKGSESAPIDLEMEELFTTMLQKQEEGEITKVGEEYDLEEFDTTGFPQSEFFGGLKIGNGGVVLFANDTICRTGPFTYVDSIDFVNTLLASKIYEYLGETFLPILFCTPEIKKIQGEAAFVHTFPEDEYPEGMPELVSLRDFVLTEEGAKKFRKDLFVPTFMAFFLLRLMGRGGRNFSDIYTAGGKIFIFALEREDLFGSDEIVSLSGLPMEEDGEIIVPHPLQGCEYLLSGRILSSNSGEERETLQRQIDIMNSALKRKGNKELIINFLAQLQETIGLSPDPDVPADLTNLFWDVREYEPIDGKSEEETKELHLEGESFAAKCLFNYVFFEILTLGEEQQEVPERKRSREERKESKEEEEEEPKRKKGNGKEEKKPFNYGSMEG